MSKVVQRRLTYTTVAPITLLMKKLFNIIGKIALLGLVANEVRGLVLAVPVMYALYQSGGTLMAIWIAVCSLAGIALTVVIPILVHRRLTRRRS